jgi:hypothetical protein
LLCFCCFWGSAFPELLPPTVPAEASPLKINYGIPVALSISTQKESLVLPPPLRCIGLLFDVQKTEANITRHASSGADGSIMAAERGAMLRVPLGFQFWGWPCRRS